MTQDELKMVLAALEELHNTNSYWWQEVDEQTLKKIEHSTTALKEALAQPEQEPVAWMSEHDVGFRKSEFGATPTVPLYTTPPQRTEPVIDKSAAIRIATALGWTPPRTWVGLTDEEIEQGCKESWVTLQAWQSGVWWAEARLKQKNGYAEEKNT